MTEISDGSRHAGCKCREKHDGKDIPNEGSSPGSAISGRMSPLVSVFAKIV
jgi:hypothetical protein